MKKIIEFLKIFFKNDKFNNQQWIEVYLKYKGDLTKLRKEETIIIKAPLILDSSYIKCDNLIVESNASIECSGNISIENKPVSKIEYE